VYTLIGADGRPYSSETPGTLGGNSRLRIYGRLDCRSANRWVGKGYEEIRVFFADEETAIAAGYRPCGTCMRDEYREWKKDQEGTS
jgi:methylphosphotriester-DNA--protein-cysteine methyltransferase